VIKYQIKSIKINNLKKVNNKKIKELILNQMVNQILQILKKSIHKTRRKEIALIVKTIMI
jgi:hypothetical protein